MKENAITLAGNRFTWVGNTGSIFITDFPKKSIPVIWTAASSTGFSVRSQRTGVLMQFLFSHFERDVEGELTAIVLKSVDHRFVIKIFND